MLPGPRGGMGLGLSAGPTDHLLLAFAPAPDVSPKPTYTFKIPEVHFPRVRQCVQAYYADCVALLSKAMSCVAPDNSVLLARYLYLRGLVRLAQGQLLDALLDFQSLCKTDLSVFPDDLVRSAVQALPGPERAQAERAPELRRLISQVLDQPGEAPKADERVKHFELPSRHLPLGDFVQRVQESGIVKDAGLIGRLFEALTVGEALAGRGGLWLWREGCAPARAFREGGGRASTGRSALPTHMHARTHVCTRACTHTCTHAHTHAIFLQAQPARRSLATCGLRSGDERGNGSRGPRRQGLVSLGTWGRWMLPRRCP